MSLHYVILENRAEKGQNSEFDLECSENLVPGALGV